jgi:peptidoglycan/xylan/chitin deacetylase (PgdA/CDA1 family)
MKRLAILGYHKIGPPPADGWNTWFFIPADTFAQQLKELQGDGWHVIDLATFVRSLSTPGILPDRAALLTFDDAYRSMRTVAMPLLQELALPSILFVPTDHIGKPNRFDWGVEPDELICDWDDLQALDQSGVAIQSHAASHHPFSQMELNEQKAELLRSKAVLEDGLGKEVSVIAFPFGDDGANPERLRSELEAAGYCAAFLYGGGIVSVPAENPYRLTRLAMGPDTKIREALPT